MKDPDPFREVNEAKTTTAKIMADRYWPLLSKESQSAILTMNPPTVCERIITLERENKCMRRCLDDVAAQQRRDAGSQPTRAQPDEAISHEPSSHEPSSDEEPEPEVVVAGYSNSLGVSMRAANGTTSC